MAPTTAPAVPLRIGVLTDEPGQASYLATALDLQLPGLVRVRSMTLADGAADDLQDGPDLVLWQRGARADQPLAASKAAGVPFIVLAQGPMALADVDRIVHSGAEDVLELGQMTAHGLAAAVLKAMRRHARSFPSGALGTTASSL